MRAADVAWLGGALVHVQAQPLTVSPQHTELLGGPKASERWEKSVIRLPYM